MNRLIPIPVGKKLRVSVDSLSQFTQCAICLDIIKLATCAQMCCHRCCSECYKKCLDNNKQCPNCREAVKTKRALRRDNHFDHILNAIYGNVYTFEEEVARIQSRVEKRPKITKALPTTTTTTTTTTLKPKSTKVVEIDDNDNSSNEKETTTRAKTPPPPPSLSFTEIKNKFSCVLSSHPNLNTLNARFYLWTGMDFTVHDLNEFLRKHLASHRRFLIYVQTDDPDQKEWVVAKDEKTVGELKRTLSSTTLMLNLYFL